MTEAYITFLWNKHIIMCVVKFYIGSRPCFMSFKWVVTISDSYVKYRGIKLSSFLHIWKGIKKNNRIIRIYFSIKFHRDKCDDVHFNQKNARKVKSSLISFLMPLKLIRKSLLNTLTYTTKASGFYRSWKLLKKSLKIIWKFLFTFRGILEAKWNLFLLKWNGNSSEINSTLEAYKFESFSLKSFYSFTIHIILNSSS